MMIRAQVALAVAVFSCKARPAPESQPAAAAKPIASAPADAQAADAPGAPDAANRSAQTITPDGVGPIEAGTDPTTVGALFPGMTVKTEHDEAEDHSFDTIAVSDPAGKRLLVVVVDNYVDEHAIFRVEVVAPSFATDRGIRVGSSPADLAAAYPDASCKRARYDANPEGFDSELSCASPSLPNLTFQLDPQARKVKKLGDGKVALAKLAGLTFERILWLPPRDPAR